MSAFWSSSRRRAGSAAFLLAALATSCKAPPSTPGPDARQQAVASKDAPQKADPSKLPEDAALVYLRAEGQLGPGAGVLLIDLSPPAGAKLTLDAPVSVRGSGGIGLGFPNRLSGPLGKHPLPLRLPIDVADGATGPAQVDLSYYWCTEGAEAACRRERAQLEVQLDLTGSGAGGEAHVSHTARGDRS